MSNIINRRIATVFDVEGLSYDTGVRLEKVDLLWESHFQKQILDTYLRLGGQRPADIHAIEMPFYPIQMNSKVIVGDDELRFNRYIAICLRSPFYTDFEGAKLDAYLRYCRQFESNCKKVGLVSGVWSNALSENHFGLASERGDFFGNGSPGWKMVAFQSMLRDMLATLQGLEVVHFSIYDQIMSEGRLLSVGELLKSTSGDHYSTFAKYLRRRLRLPVSATEEPM